MSEPQAGSDNAFSGGSEPAAGGSRRKWLLPAILAAVLLIGISTASYLKIQHDKRLAEDKETFNSAVDQSVKLRSVKLYEQARKPLTKYTEQGMDDGRRGEAYIHMATIYEAEKKPQQALEAYREAEKLLGAGNNAVVFGIARVSAQLGDKQTAVEYYQKSLAIMESLNDPAVDGDIRLIKRLIAELEAKP